MQVPSPAAVLPSKVKPSCLLTCPHGEVLRIQQTQGHKTVIYVVSFAQGFPSDSKAGALCSRLFWEKQH